MAPEVPHRIRKPEFHKGMLVAKNVGREEDGTPVFGKVNSETVMQMQRDRKCQTCGQKIAKTDWCVFPGAFWIPKYQEAPLHVECARYSSQVCPMILKKRDTFGFSVCKTYEVIEFEPPYWADPGCIPTYGTLSGSDKFILSMAHDMKPKKDGSGYYCATCPEDNDNLGRMTYDEFMRWSR